MAYYPSKGHSFWLDGQTEATYSPLTNDLKVDVAVIGGGIAGLTAAYLLKQRGKKVAVFEKHTIGTGVTGYTTAKVTSQHSLTYSNLVKKHGEAVARIYGQANEAAITHIETIIQAEQIDCDWRREDNYVFTESDEEVETLRQEAEDAARLGLPARFVTETPLPFAVKGAVKFENQATFHVVNYLKGLARAINGNGSFVFENTKAGHFEDGERCTFSTQRGGVVAQQIIHATNAPSTVKDHIAYGLVEYPTRSYIVAGRIETDIPGMYINTGSPTRSILPIESNGEKWLLIGGEGHFVGMSGRAKKRYETLTRYAKQQFGIEKIEYAWSTWDFVAYDQLPLIGKLYPSSKNSYVVTGLRKWGMTNSMVAGQILADTLTGSQNPWTEVFRPNRSSAIKSLPKGLLQGLGTRK